MVDIFQSLGMELTKIVKNPRYGIDLNIVLQLGKVGSIVVSFKCLLL